MGTDVRKLTVVGNSHCISLPAAWLVAEEKRIGHPIEHIILTISERSITLKVFADENTPPIAPAEPIPASIPPAAVSS
jgi:hypothetical protein